MASTTYERLLSALGKGRLDPAYYFHGAEDILKDEAATRVLDAALDPSWRDFNFEQRPAGQLDAEALHTLLNTLPMMANRRVVFLRELESLAKKPRLREVLLRYLDRPGEDTVLVMVQGAGVGDRALAADEEIVQRTVAVDFRPLTSEEAAAWLAQQATRRGVTLEREAVDHLLEVTGGELGFLRTELDKLSTLDPSAPVTLSQVEALVGVRHGETPFDWRDAVLEGNAAQALTLLQPVLQQSGVSGVSLVTVLGIGLTGLSLARAHLDRGTRPAEISNRLYDALKFSRLPGTLVGEWKRAVNNWLRWAPAWSQRRIQGALRAALVADKALKSTRISDEAGVLTDLVLELGGIRGSGGEDRRTGASTRERAGARGGTK
jgi:DNA polymerase-3 subunit delta